MENRKCTTHDDGRWKRGEKLAGLGFGFFHALRPLFGSRLKILNARNKSCDACDVRCGKSAVFCIHSFYCDYIVLLDNLKLQTQSLA